MEGRREPTIHYACLKNKILALNLPHILDNSTRELSLPTKKKEKKTQILMETSRKEDGEEKEEEGGGPRHHRRPSWHS